MAKRFKIKKRLTVAFITVAICASISGIVGCIAMNYIASQYSYALVNYGFSQGDIGKAMITFADTHSATRAVIGYTDAKVVSEAVSTHDQKKASCLDYMEGIKSTLTAAEETAAYNAAVAAMDKYWNIESQVIAKGNTTDINESLEAQAMASEQLLPLYDEVYSHMAELMELNVTKGGELESNLLSMRVVLFIVSVVIIVLSLFISLALGTNIASGIANPLINLTERLRTFATGNLADEFPKIDTEDEVADMIKIASAMAKNLTAIIYDAKYRLEEMSSGNYTAESKIPENYVGDFKELHSSIHDVNDKMNVTLHQIEEAASQVSAGSGNMAEAAQSLAEGATEQAGAVEEMLATITNLTESTVKQAQDSESVYHVSQEYAKKADNSKNEMEGMVTTMSNISETSKKIGGIIAEIEDIASQTNLLSLNASIEAARAGEAGKGFAVVADQIGKLAADSAQSAVNTRELIMSTLGEIEAGTLAAERTAEAINEVVNGINNISENVRESSIQANQNAESMRQVEQGVNQISEVVQANSATAQETSATSEELSAQAETLNSLVKQFVLR